MSSQARARAVHGCPVEVTVPSALSFSAIDRSERPARTSAAIHLITWASDSITVMPSAPYPDGRRPPIQRPSVAAWSRARLARSL